MKPPNLNSPPLWYAPEAAPGLFDCDHCPGKKPSTFSCRKCGAWVCIKHVERVHPKPVRDGWHTDEKSYALCWPRCKS
jgi:hypothetical protein